MAMPLGCDEMTGVSDSQFSWATESEAEPLELQITLGKETHVEGPSRASESQIRAFCITRLTPTRLETVWVPRSLLRGATPAVPGSVDATRGAALDLFSELKGIAHGDVDEALRASRRKA